MPRHSTVMKLPVSTRKQLDRALMRGEMTIDQLHAFIAGCCAPGEDTPSRSAIGRYAAKFNETAKAMRENREMAMALAQELGPESLEGEQGRLLVEILRGLVFQAMQQRAADPDAKFDAGEVAKIARSLKDLSHAMHLEQDFAKRIREEERRKVEEEVRGRVQALGSAQDLRKLTDEELERKISELAAQA